METLLIASQIILIVEIFNFCLFLNRRTILWRGKHD
jgi:hypothetical protein